jgi:hypothetical protein
VLIIKIAKNEKSYFVPDGLPACGYDGQFPNLGGTYRRAEINEAKIIQGR